MDNDVHARENDRQRGYGKVCRFFYGLDVVGVIIKKKNIGYVSGLFDLPKYLELQFFRLFNLHFNL